MTLPPLSDMERLLLMAAAVQGFGPRTDITRANTAKVVLQALQWSGLGTAEVYQQWEQFEWPAELDKVYQPLVGMTQQVLRDGGARPPERPGPALFEGGGNWGVPGDPQRPACDPRYNSCRLTALGGLIARALLAEQPEFGKPNAE